MLGPLLVEGDGRSAITPSSPNQRTVLAVLLANQGRAVSVDALVDALWGDRPPPSAERSLRTYVSRLRQVLGGRLRGGGGSYWLEPGPDDRVDAVVFEQLVTEASGLAATDAASVLAEALDLWRGDAYVDAADLDAIAAEARRLAELRTAAREAWARALFDAGRAADATATAEALVTEHPLRERSWMVLIDALAADGRQAEALRAYQRASEQLADAGLEPSAALRETERRVLTDRPAADAGVAPQSDRPPRAPLSSLVGRDADLAGVRDLLERARVVTLHGPGGVGKTRLAQELAGEWGDRHRLGVRIVELARLTDPDSVRVAITAALGLALPSGSAREALARAGVLDVLVVLDNCEHVIDAVAEAVELLTAGGGALRVLATSRERLAVPGEHSWPLAPLDTSDPSGPAVELFVERVAAREPARTFTDAEREIIARVVRSVDGLPLAIEMAAARAGTLGLAELEAVLAERTDILRSARRRDDPRHRTLRTVIEWSEALLSDDEREVLHDLSVFAGPVHRETLEAVLDRPAVVDAVCDLVDRSLVVVERSRGATTYDMLGTVRRHGRDGLASSGREAAVRRRHAEHYVEIAAAADAQLRSPREGEASERLGRSFDELRAAHEWARRESPALAQSLSARLHLYATSRIRDEVHRWAVAIEPSLDDSADAAITLSTLAFAANNAGLFDMALAAGERSLELAGDTPLARYALEMLFDTAAYQGDLDRAQELARRFLDVAERAGDTHHIAMAYSSIGLALSYSGRHEEAIAALADVDTSAMSPSDTAWVEYSRGEVLLDRDPANALDLLGRAIELADGVGERFVAGVARVSSVSLLARVGEPERALPAFADIVDHWHRRGSQTHQLTTLRNLVGLFDRIGAHAAAAELLGAVTGGGGAPSFGEEARRLAEAEDHARAALGPAYDERFERGSRRDVPAAALAAIEAIHEIAGE